jgi:hypothetical protein
MVDRGTPARQLALVERWVESLRTIPALDAVWLEGSLAGDRAHAASDIDMRAAIADAAFAQLWEVDRSPLLAGLGEHLVMDAPFIRALTHDGLIVELSAYPTSQIEGMALYEWKMLFSRLPAGGPHFQQVPEKPQAEVWPDAEPLTPAVVRQRMDYALWIMAEAPACFYSNEPQALMYTVDIARNDLMRLMYRRIGMRFGKRAKHLSQVLPAAWLTELTESYPAASPLKSSAFVEALIRIFRFQGAHLQALNDMAGGGFEPFWYWRLYEQMSEELRALAATA